MLSPGHVHGERIDGKADVYALGAVLDEMLTSRPPFRAASEAGMVRSVLPSTRKPTSRRRGEGVT